MVPRMPATTPAPAGSAPWWPGAATWVAAWAALLALDGTVDLSNLALLLVLASALATLWLPGWAALLACDPIGVVWLQNLQSRIKQPACF